ncbi:MAG TPA: TrkA family potassium uptake protein [Micromonosporaceae bacterium]
MRALIAGGGRLGTQVARALGEAGNEVTVVDLDEDRAATLAERVPARYVTGDATDPPVLERAGALTADLLVAATGDDDDNLVICVLAKRQFAVPRVVARVNDADNAWLFDQRWGVDVAIPSAAPLISLIAEATGASDTVSLVRLGHAGVNVIETAISPTSRAAGRAISEIILPAGTVVAAVVRSGRPTVPDPRFELRPGDELLVVSEHANAPDIHAAFQ